ncbi:MAG: metal ABC transporter ATP-binding protein [Chloroflexota bacterium]
METLSTLRSRGVRHEPHAPLLTVSGVSLGYLPAAPGGLRNASNGPEKIYALQDVSFKLTGGERVAVVGPNGAGKSTLFKIIAGTLQPDEGEIQVSGHDPGRHICIAYVPQRNQIDWTFPVTVEDVVMMGRIGQIGLFRRPKKRDWEIVRASLQRVQGSHLAQKQIGELSGGQQQRVFIARALAQRAELLLLDEPFTGLDAPGQEAIFRVLEQLHEDGVTYMVATHDLNVAAERFDRVMLLNKTVVAFGPPDAALTSQNLMTAYGGHMHVLGEEGGPLVLTDTCCAGEEETVGRRGA